MAGNTADAMTETAPSKHEANTAIPDLNFDTTPADDDTDNHSITSDLTDDSFGPLNNDDPEFPYMVDDDDGEGGFEAEDLTNYVPGGFHPVVLGDVLGEDGRFRVVHKLGYGGYATVWLCHDKITNKWRAVKIISARQSNDDCLELKALALFGAVDPAVLAASPIQLPLESFWIEGPNGRHLCFVLPLLGANLAGAFHSYGHIDGLMKDVCFQLVDAMRFIHSHGICHGDFRPGNVLFRLVPGVDEWEEDAMMKLLGEPELMQVERADGTDGELDPSVPQYLVEVGRIDSGSGVCSPSIAVIDFGVSYHISNPPIGKSTGIPLDYVAPEDLFEQDDLIGFPTDLWALAASLCEVRRGFTPFASAAGSHGPPDAVEMMETTLGPMPDPYRTVWWKWGFDFLNCPPDGDDREGWRDPSTLVSVRAAVHRYNETARAADGLPGNYLHWRLCQLVQSKVSKHEGADMVAQWAADPSRLPRNDRDRGEEVDYEDILRHTMPRDEADKFFDLLCGIFRWLPKERASLDEIARHEWFGDRDARRLTAAAAAAAAVATSPDSSSSTGGGLRKRARSPSLSGSPETPDKKARCGTAGAAADESGDDKKKKKKASETWAVFLRRVTVGNVRRGARSVARCVVWVVGVFRRGFSGALRGLMRGPWWFDVRRRR